MNPLKLLSHGKEVVTFVPMRDEKRLSAVRAQVMGGFSQNTWLKQEDEMGRTLEKLVWRVREAGAGRAPVQMDHWVGLWSCDTISQLAFSDNRRYLDAGADVDGVA